MIKYKILERMEYDDTKRWSVHGLYTTRNIKGKECVYDMDTGEQWWCIKDNLHIEPNCCEMSYVLNGKTTRSYDALYVCNHIDETGISEYTIEEVGETTQ